MPQARVDRKGPGSVQRCLFKRQAHLHPEINTTYILLFDSLYDEGFSHIK
jgi:hypothetical protein